MITSFGYFISELHGVVTQLVSENQEKKGLVSLLKTEKEKMQSEIKKKVRFHLSIHPSIVCHFL